MTTQPKTVRTRIAPSPTGEDLHIGNVYTALINFAFAKKHNGQFIVRIEDTDRTRYVEGSEQRILNSLKWLGLSPDESLEVGGPFVPYRQSERLDLYKKYAEELVEKGHAYYCTCTAERLARVREEQQKKKKPPMYDRHCRGTIKKPEGQFVIRLQVPDSGETSFEDIIRGKVSVENKVLDDQVLLKSDGFPTYHLAVVIDDHLMEISHVIRAEEWISSTPKHILLYQFLGWEVPRIAHLPILRNPDKSKLSKRKNPVWVSWYRKKGYLPEAILNYLGLMGFSMPDERELFSLEEFTKEIELERIQTTGPVFDVTKLDWMNGEYLRQLPVTNYELRIKDYLKTYVIPAKAGIHIDPRSESGMTLIEKTIPLIQTRLKTFSEYWPMCEFFFKAPTTYEKEINKVWMVKVIDTVKTIEPFDHATMYSELSKLSDELQVGKSKLFMDIRIAVTGKKVGPPLFESMEILGKDESVKRLRELL